MLTIYRRHIKTCSHVGDRFFRRCKCPVWIEGVHDGKYRRHSLKTRSWERADQTKWEIEDGKPQDITVECVFNQFIADSEARQLRPATISKYRTLKMRFIEFCKRRNLSLIRHIEPREIIAFRSSQKNQSARTQGKDLERLKTFFRFAQSAGFCLKNPTFAIKPPKAGPSCVLPFSEDEMKKILANIGNARLRAFVDVLRFTGLRIGDAAMLTTDKVRDGKLFPYTAKSGTHVWVPLPPTLIHELSFLKPRMGYYFLRGASLQVHTVADLWRRELKKLFLNCGMANAHPHQFRHYFSVSLLSKGVPIEQVAMLLGHSSHKITERHYNAWVQSRQEQLELSVGKLWESLPAVPVSDTIQ